MRIDTNYINNPHFYDVIIVGGGPAGLTAALYAQRANLKTAFIEKDTPGGKIVRTMTIENYPGFSNVGGADLAMNLFKQATAGAKFIFGEVVNVFKLNNIFHVATADNMVRYCKALIIATGMKEKELQIPNEKKYYGKGISYCAICDGALYKNKEVAVIGGGNSALEESLYLADIVSKVYLIHRRDEFRAESVIVDRVKNNKKIELILDSVATKFNGDNNKLTSLTYKNLKTEVEQDLEVACVFPFIGFLPQSDFLAKLEIEMENGYPIVNSDMSTNVEGLFCAGDLISKNIRQITTAVADGTIAALSAKKYIEENFDK